MIPILLIIFIHAVIGSKVDPYQALLNTMNPKMTYLTSELAKHVTTRIQKRSGVIGSLKNQVQNYILSTYGKQAINSFKPQLERTVENSIARFHTLHKRSFDAMSPDQQKQAAQNYSRQVATKLNDQFKVHAKVQFDQWTRRQRQKNVAPEYSFVSNANANTNPNTNAVSPRYFYFMSNFFRVQKRAEAQRRWRGFFPKTNKNVAIWNIVLGFLLVPIFFSGFVVTFGAIVAVLLWTIFFVGPITNKILFGSWL